MVVMGEIYLVNGQRVELPASVGAMLGYTPVPNITNTTPFAAPAPTLNLRQLPSGTSSGPGDPCAGLKARISKYGPLDPQPVIRQALLAKCEEQQRAAGGVRAVNPDEYPEKSGIGMSTNTKIAIGVAALVGLAIVAKKLKKR